MSANVNKPTDNKVKEADVNRKLQIYGIISAFENGKAPSNDQIDVALNSFLESKALSKKHEGLSEDGRVLIEDVRDVIQKAKNMVLSKNEGNLLQDFIWQTTQFDPKTVKGPNAPVSKDTAKRDGDEALKGMRTLGTLLITNGQFRKLLKDASVLLRDMAGDAATNAATKVKPSEDQLKDMDRPAEDNTWHDAPDMSKDGLKSQAKNVYGGNPKKDAKDAAQAGHEAGGPARNDGQDVDANAGANAAKANAKDKISKNMDPETKEELKKRNDEYRAKTKEYLKKKMPEERKEQVIYRLKKAILECQQHPDYSQAVQTLLRLAENYGKHGRTMGQGSKGTAKEARTGFAAAEADLRTLIERFANGTSTDDLWASINQIYRDAEKDDELKNWFKKMDSYIRRCLLEQGYILDDDSAREWDTLYDQGRYLLREKYRTHTDRVVDETKFVGDQFDKDPQNKAFAQACQKLFNHLGNDENGNPTFKTHLVKDLTEVILPGILKNTAYIPIPRIEYADSQFDVVIENLILESDNFMPNITEISSENFFRFGRKKITNKHNNMIEVKVSGVQMDLRDVSFHVKRKTGFPSLTDTGSADILLPGDGLSFKMKVSTADKKDRQNFFKVDKVDVDFKELDIVMKKSNHKLLFKIAKPIMMKAMRAPLQKAVEQAIKDKCNELDNFLSEIKKEATRAKEEAKNDPENAPNVYKRYYNAAQKRALQGKEKAEDFAADKKVNMAMTKEDSIFPNISLPGGVSTKATEYRELARKGDKWESPVFSIGHAKKSSDVPRAPKVEKKPHAAANPDANPVGGLSGAAGGMSSTPGNPSYTQGGNLASTLPANGNLASTLPANGNGVATSAPYGGQTNVAATNSALNGKTQMGADWNAAGQSVPRV